MAASFVFREASEKLLFLYRDPQLENAFNLKEFGGFSLNPFPQRFGFIPKRRWEDYKGQRLMTPMKTLQVMETLKG